MRFRDDARDIKADAHPREGPGSPRAADKRMTELRGFVGRDADPFVRDRDLSVSVPGRQLDANPSAGRRVLHRVADEVHEELLDARLVAGGGHARTRLDPEAVATFLGGLVCVALA